MILSFFSGGNSEPKMEELLEKIKEMQLGKKVLEEDLKEAQLLRKSLQKELDTLHAEQYQMEEIQKEREESYRVLQFKCDELECEAKRLLQLNSKSEALIEQYTFQIQEARLKHRKQRMKFENQLQQLIEQHKNLYSVYSPDRLPSEIESLENARSQLLKAEQVKLAQLNRLAEGINQTLSDTKA
ncbi:synaptonemal complex central element protein 1 isoform X2 [Anguilla anguilla]|uniref:synaptonemal complex central element protein 1 isoform X2 n=1 Tax=Anguilla anguilla TaxID=7936 RepID=UPI0015AD988C|nr:synaptonemal complex central element protein 1 isoform X2 [Anguilla anguilla]